MKKFRYLRPLLIFIGIALAITMLSRVVLLVLYKERITQVAGYGMLFPIGLHMDMIIISYLSLIPLAVLSLVPDKYVKASGKFLSVYFVVFLLLFLFMEMATPEFVAEYDTRPNRLFLDYLIYPKEVFTMLVKGRLMTMIVVLVISAAAIYFGFKNRARLFSIPSSPYWFRLVLFPVLAFLLVWGARGSLTSKRPLNPSNAVFSNDQLTNSLGINSLYSVAYAAYGMKNEVDAAKLYGRMGETEAYARVKKYMNADESSFTDADIPLLHNQVPAVVRERPYNLVIFLQESLGADYVGCLGGMPLTPELDKMAEEGLLLTHLYCTGTRSVRGIEAVTTGFMPTPSPSVVKLSNSQSGFFSLAALLKRAGYNTSFVYGGMSNFDNMASFFSGNGFDNIIDEKVFDREKERYAFKGTWGYSDEDLVTKANDYYSSLGEEPFFSLIFSSSNHDPFEFPDGRIELYEQPKNTVHNAMKYADYAIGRLFELAKAEDYYENTIFVVVADHNTRTYGKNLVPVDKFHIPAVIVGPGVEKGTYDRLCSQVDIPPTLLGMIGLEAETPMPGRDLMTLPDSVAGRAMMQFHDINAFRVEDKVVIMQPNNAPLQFDMVDDFTFIPAELEPELAKDALAHVMASYYMYKENKYRLPEDRRGN